MILIPPLRTRRLAVQMKELPIGRAIQLAGIHPRQNEFAITAFLGSVIEKAEAHTADHVTEPRLWTVQERTLAVCHYMAATADNGEADFEVGERGKLTDYLDTRHDYVADVEAGEAAQDKWRMVPLTGQAAEIIEKLQGDVEGVPLGRMHWLVGTMAAQLRRVGADGAGTEDAPQGDSDLTDWVRARMQIFAAYPQSDFAQMLQIKATGQEKLMHLFRMAPADDGLVCMPNEKGVEGGLPPARFPVDECIGPIARELAQPMPQP